MAGTILARATSWEDGRLKVLDGHGVGHGGVAEVVGRAVDVPPLEAAAGPPQSSIGPLGTIPGSRPQNHVEKHFHFAVRLDRMAKRVIGMHLVPIAPPFADPR